MKVFLVQRLTWMFNDVTYELFDDCPVKAFQSKEDAEVYCAEQEARYRNQAFVPIDWAEDTFYPPWKDTERRFQFFEVVEAELTQ